MMKGISASGQEKTTETSGVKRGALFPVTISVIALLFLLLQLMGAASADAALISDPIPSVTTSGTSIVLFKDLNAWGNYGYYDHGADILYCAVGDSGSWTIPLKSPGSSTSPGYDLTSYNNKPATVTISLSLDDHSTPISDYSLSISLAGTTVFNGLASSLGLQHGQPYGSGFTNWTPVSYYVASVTDPLTVSISNTSGGSSGDWIAIDSIKMEFTRQAPVPIPASLLLFGPGLLGLAAVRKPFKK
jgi:hypothetical protein